MIKKVIDNFSILISILFIVGILNLITYYYSFSLPIQNFISVSEISLIVSDNLMAVLFIYFFLTSMNVLTNEMKLGNKIREILKKHSLYVTTILTIVVLVFNVLFIVESTSYLKVKYFSIFFFSFYLIVINTEVVKLYFLENIEFKLFIQVLIITSFITINFTVIEIKSVKNGRYIGTAVQTNDMNYVSNDSIYFIGNTEKYVFFSAKNDCIVIPMENVKKIYLKYKD